MATKQTQKLIIDTAIALFNEHGSGSVSVNRIAEACQISKGNLHYHFKTKQLLIRAIYDRMMQEIRDDWVDDLTQPTAQHMQEMFERQLDQIWRYRFFYREMMALLSADSELKHSFSRYRLQRSRLINEFFVALIEHGVLTGPADAGTLNSLVTLSWILSDNWINYIAVDDDDIYPDFVRAGYDLILDLFRPYLSPETLATLQRADSSADTDEHRRRKSA